MLNEGHWIETIYDPLKSRWTVILFLNLKGTHL
jgi:hypothetical protein